MTDALPPTIGAAHPAAFHRGPGHVIVYATPAFLEAFGSTCLGLPAREALPELPARTFALMDRVLQEGRPLARRIETPHGQRRLVVVPRRDPDGETYGVTTHLVAVAASVEKR
jgi:PAS domain-containing protein